MGIPTRRRALRARSPERAGMRRRARPPTRAAARVAAAPTPGSSARAAIRCVRRARHARASPAATRHRRVLLGSTGVVPERARGARSRYVDNDAMGFIPVGDLMRELVLALGAALLVGNLAVLVRERRRRPDDERPKPNMRIVTLNIVLGVVMAAWGLGSLLTAGWLRGAGKGRPRQCYERRGGLA